jgi:hypothetical protein
MSGTRRLPRWPLVLIALPAAVAVWSGWVGLAALCGFGIVHPLPGLLDGFTINTSITLPIGVECYAAYAMGAWLTPGVPETARKFARRSAIGSLALGVLGQVAYHLLSAAHATHAPWPVVVLVSSLPVIVLGFGAALSHLLRSESGALPESAGAAVSVAVPTAPPGAVASAPEPLPAPVPRVHSSAPRRAANAVSANPALKHVKVQSPAARSRRCAGSRPTARAVRRRRSRFRRSCRRRLIAPLLPRNRLR